MIDIINYFSEIVLPWITWNNLHIYEEFIYRLNSFCTLWSLFRSNKMANKSEAKVYFIIDNHVFLLAMLSVHVYNFSIHAIIMDEMTTDRPLCLHNEKNNFSWKKCLILKFIKIWRLVKFGSRQRWCWGWLKFSKPKSRTLCIAGSLYRKEVLT